MCIRSVFYLLVILAASHIFAAAQTPTPTPNELAEYIKANYTKREVSIPVRDGVKLFTSIYEPKEDRKSVV